MCLKIVLKTNINIIKLQKFHPLVKRKFTQK